MPDILLMDDDEQLARVMRATLAKDGFAPRVVFDGPSALAAAAERPFDLCLLDVDVPGANGFEVCRAIRSAETADSHATIVMVTARQEIASKLMAFAAGADDYLVKPLDLQELRTRVSRWLGTRALQDELVKKRRREAIQEIVISICHEINNPLQVAVMGIDLTLQKKLDEETSKDLTAVLDNLNRISEVLAVLRLVEDRTIAYVGGDRMIDVHRDGT